MSRYINADRVHRDCEMRFADTGVPYEWAYALTIIDQAQTADVAPVVLGWWERVDSSYYRWTPSGGTFVDRATYRCSHCGRGTAVKSNYCPNCGAKMDGERKDNKNG